MKSKNLIYALLIIVVTFLTSCEKEDIENGENLSCSNMLYFETVEEYDTELNKVLKMNENELSQWQELKGFTSLGIEAEKFYKSIDPEKFKSADEIKQFVQNNSKFLRLVVDENEEYMLEITLSETPFRFLANADGIFQVKNSIYKVFNEALVLVDEKKINELIDADFTSAQKIEGSSIISLIHDSKKSVQTDCQPDYFNEYSDDERIRLYIGAWRGQNYPFMVTGEFEARAYHKTLGIWFYAKRFIACNINIGLTYQNADANWVSTTATYYETGIEDYSIHKYIVVGYGLNPNYYELSLDSYDSWAVQIYTPTAYAVCN